MNRHDERLRRLAQRHAVDGKGPGLLIHNYEGAYSLELGGETWPSLDALHAANPGHGLNNGTVITWV